MSFDQQIKEFGVVRIPGGASDSELAAAIAAEAALARNASNLSSGTVALARGGTGVDLSATGAATHVLAQAANHTVSARALVAADIPSTLGATIFSGPVSSAGELSLKSGTGGTVLYTGPTITGYFTATISYLQAIVKSYLDGSINIRAGSLAGSKVFLSDKNTVTQAQIDETGLTLPVTATPASASATGVTGNIAWDASYIYICTATNTWKRTAIATW